MHITHPQTQSMRKNGKHSNLRAEEYPEHTFTLLKWKGNDSISFYDSQGTAWPRHQEAAASSESSAARQAELNLASPLSSCVNLASSLTSLCLRLLLCKRGIIIIELISLVVVQIKYNKCKILETLLGIQYTLNKCQLSLLISGIIIINLSP